MKRLVPFGAGDRGKTPTRAGRSAEHPLDELPLEIRLLVRCARTLHDEASRRELGDLAERIGDWDGLLAAAAQHQVLPLVAHSLGQVGDLVPAEQRDQLNGYVRAHAMRNLHLAGVLGEVLAALDEAHIVAFPYKGPALAVTAYGSLLLRSFSDLDVLVRKSDFLQAKEVLETIGFAAKGEPMSDREFLRWKSAYSFVRDEVYVDLQWGSTAFEGLSVPIDDAFWETETTIDIAGKTARAIAADDLLLFVCAHGSRHRWDRLKWVCDVAEMMRVAADLDWDVLLRRADDVGAGRVLRAGLVLAETVLDAPIPESVRLANASDPVAARLAAEGYERLFFDRPYSDTAQYLYDLRTRNRWRDRLRYLGFQFVQATGEDRVAMPLPRWLSFLYPVLVPLRRLWRIVAKAIRGTGASRG